MHAERDTGSYPKGIKVSDGEFAAVPLTPHAFHGEWNSSIAPSREGDDDALTVMFFPRRP